MPGPPKTPTPILQMRGSWRAKEREKTEPKLDEKAPQAPLHLSPEARVVWDEMIEILMGMRVLTSADGAALARYAEMSVRWRRANEALRSGETFITPKGYICQRPEVGIVNKLDAALLKIEQQYGLTPASRPNVQAAPLDDEQEGALASRSG